jgi:hypothetical protein
MRTPFYNSISWIKYLPLLGFIGPAWLSSGSRTKPRRTPPGSSTRRSWRGEIIESLEMALEQFRGIRDELEKGK